MRRASFAACLCCGKAAAILWTLSILNAAFYRLLASFSCKEVKACDGSLPRIYIYNLPEELDGTADAPAAYWRYKDWKISTTFESNSSPRSVVPRNNKSVDPVYWPNFFFDVAMTELLKESALVVQNPAQANLFFVPAHLVAVMWSQINFDDGVSVDALAYLREREAALLALMRSVGDYWDRSQGADHLVGSLRCSYLLENRVFNDMLPALWGNKPIRYCTQEPALGFPFVADLIRTIKVPYYTPIVDEAELKPASQRRISIFFAGSSFLSRSWVKSALAQTPRSLFIEIDRHHDAHQHQLPNHAKNLSAHFLSAQFALILPGDTPESLRLHMAMAAGALPIVVSDSLRLPFPEDIDWDSIVVRLHEMQLALRPSTLARTIEYLLADEVAMDKRQIRMMQMQRKLQWDADGVVKLTLEAACDALATTACSKADSSLRAVRQQSL